MELEAVDRWIQAYVDAWRANDPEAVKALFADDARYFTHPFREAWEGRDAIAQSWMEDPDPPGSWECDYRALAVNGSTGVIRGHTTYFRDDRSVETEFANIFVVEFNGEGRATEFTEWFMESNPSPRDGA